MESAEVAEEQAVSMEIDDTSDTKKTFDETVPSVENEKEQKAENADKRKEGEANQISIEDGVRNDQEEKQPIESREEKEPIRDQEKDEAPIKDKVGEKESNEKLVENELNLKCFDCFVTACVMWRKLDSSTVLCNICHLKRVKNAGQASVASTQKSGNGTVIIQNNKSKDIPSLQRISKRKSKTNKKFNNGVLDRIIKNGNSKNRRSMFKKKPMKSTEGIAAIVAAQSVYHHGLLYEVGDIVCTSDLEGGTYFAQIRGFLQDEFCEKTAVVTWLIPTVPNPVQFDPMLFVPGLDEDTPRPMECFDFVCRAPTNLFKSKLVHPPYLRIQSNLDSLFSAAQLLDEVQNKNENEGTGTELGDKENTNLIEAS